MPFYSVLEEFFSWQLNLSQSMLQISWISSSFFIMRHCCSGERCGPWASCFLMEGSSAENAENLQFYSFLKVGTVINKSFILEVMPSLFARSILCRIQITFKKNSFTFCKKIDVNYRNLDKINLVFFKLLFEYFGQKLA